MDLQSKLDELKEARDEIVERLDRGMARIEKCREQGKDVSGWEDSWKLLLRQYEKVSDKISALEKTIYEQSTSPHERREPEEERLLHNF